MQPGQVFITPIVQESWIKTLTENNFPRIRPQGWPAAGPRRAEEVARIGACAAVRIAVDPRRTRPVPRPSPPCPTGRVGIRRGLEYRTKQLLDIYEYS